MSNQSTSGVRLRRPERHQVIWQASCCDDLVSKNHQARLICKVVDQLDVSAFCEPIKAREGVSGRDANDPRMLITLWLYGTTRGVGSARELARLCTESKSYQWICGGVSVNYHTLADFRVGHAEALNQLFTQVIASLVDQELVKVHRISQDGTRVRACAGASSFRGEQRLNELHKAAKEHVEELSKLTCDPEKSAGLSAKKKAARKRAARERVQRIEAALEKMPVVKEKQKTAAEQAGNGEYGQKIKKGQPRVSTTDADARVMKMANGGFNPAINVQLAVDTESRAIVGIEVTSAGSDKGLSEPMREQVQDRTGLEVKEHLEDGGFLVMDEIDRAAEVGVALFVPPTKPRDPKKIEQRYVPKSTDSEAQAEWRVRMGTDEAKAIYKERASTIETANADLKTHRGLDGFKVRGLGKARSVAIWCAMAYNLLHFAKAIIG